MEEDFTIEEVIDLMRKTKKTDPLFKPLKKLKTALENIGLQNISFAPTKRILVFHFGLGNQLDREFLNLTHPEHLSKKIQIIPGHSYCLLQFLSQEFSEAYLNQRKKIHDRPVFYQQISFQNLTRTLICLYCRDQFLKQKEMFAVSNCSSNYKEGSIPGLIMIEDIVSKQQELQLLQKIDSGKWQKLNNRRVQHHGYSFKYGRNQVDKDEREGELPEYFDKLLKRLKQLPILQNSRFDQLTINDYFAGNGIPAHFDTHSPFQQIFISISLLSGLVMDFRKYDGLEQFVYLKERSLAIFSGEARYAWTHGISGRKVDKIDNEIVYRSRRISLTFRQIKFSPCSCPYYFFCDSQGYNQQTMKKQNPLLTKFISQQSLQTLSKYTSQEIEKQYVDKAYNGFGFDFHNKVIQEVSIFMDQEMQIGEIVLDIGCGNGEYSKYVKEGVNYIGIEKCTVMSHVENEAFMDCLSLAFRDCVFDKIIFVAVLHHFASKDSRMKALSEILRVLRVGGMVCLSVLNYEVKKQTYKSSEILLEYCLPVAKLTKKEEFVVGVQKQTPRIQQRGEVYSRYYHLFDAKEFQQLLQETGFTVLGIQSSKQNLIATVMKPMK